MLPINVEEFFADGNIDGAVREAAHVLYGIEDFEYEWMSVERYMGIFHEVQPGDNALRCLDCHGPDGRIDWAGLGYEVRTVNCTDCYQHYGSLRCLVNVVSRV